MRKNYLLALPFMIAVTMLLTACGGSGTKLMSVSSSGEHTSEPFKKMMILAIAKKPENQKLFEDAFAAAVDQSGTEAIAASTVLPVDTEITRELIIETAQKEGVDCILVTHLVRLGKKNVDVPVAPAAHPTVIYDGAFYNYYPVAYAYAYTYYPDQEIEQTFVRLKTVFYELKTQKNLWSASSESIDPKSLGQIVKQLSQKVIKSLKDYELIN